MTFLSTGVHYLGQLHDTSLLKVALDQISEGQLQFAQLEQHFDTLIVGRPGERRFDLPPTSDVKTSTAPVRPVCVLREYHVHAGKTEMAASLKRQFPGEEEAIDEFLRLMKVEKEEDDDEGPRL